ncbi:hypothetical protein EG240_11775 [Paenimyroides tangerinum]|uniref:Uncharacterized protein n=1 Tax=Paenimyroides tangerinum TaxID=2488728 RepID=A0A3P3W374_9FLAO|nr:hypothetical protein [Paenimyroides tangerinum]RRJ89420.1 hypothetical protein EG240_11775 [Paenimyroides tangerinum]
MDKETNVLKLENVELLSRLPKKASKKTMIVSKALDLSVQYVQGNHIVERKADGEIRKIKRIEKLALPEDLKKGAKLCLK